MPARSSLARWVLALLSGGLWSGLGAAHAATVAPPMLDITHQCNAMARRNATLMSECVVAESEARADLLSHWSKLPDEAAERCIKLGRKAKRQPYVAMEKCLSPDLAGPAATPVNEQKR